MLQISYMFKNHVVDAIDKLIYNFVWKSKHHVKKSTLIGKPNKGGLKMPDTKSVIKANKFKFHKTDAKHGEQF